ncbi:unnamed protein product [Adineta steineri]|uniref:Uncharacterized protein n=1 Tax=Adineta steineri TaxID=433720 RepID=A0A815AM57_9BILA|nr:unnamed protein product [Adineta steineri]CAF1258910.1 unnamed protein product [Adineta steineri]CAF1400506.1 unnamed protein product [Adineta steineri]
MFSQTTIKNDIQAFYNDELISAYLLSESLLEAELAPITKAFRMNSIANFLQLLSFVRTYVLGNQLMPAIETAFILQLITDDGLAWSTTGGILVFNPHGTSATCECTSSASCNMWSAFYNTSSPDFSTYLSWKPTAVSLQVQNWFVACWPLESLLLSSLDNSFLNNQTALDVIATNFNWPSNSTPMALNIPNGINQTVTFNDTLQTSFIENFSTELNYSLYYAECRPRSCFYWINQHSSFLYIFTTLLGLYGGLSVVLRLLIPHVVGFLVRYLNRTSPQLLAVDAVTARVSWKQRARTMVKIIRDALVDLNLFKSSLRQQPSDIKQQRWTTRIYITLLTVALIILALHGILSFESKLIEVSKPSFSTVQQLQSQTNIISSLQCPCTQLTVPFGQFIQLQPLYHQVCSSDFVTDDWIKGFDDLTDLSFIANSTDFRFSQPLFVLLQALCVYSNETIVDALQTFQNTTLVSAQLLTVNDFTNQTSAVIRQFKLETTSTFIHFVQLLISQMFIESWSNSTNYSSYFAQCQPASCSYTIPQRNNLIETITRIVGLIGAPPRARFVTVGIKIRDWLKKVNVFEDTNRVVSTEQQCLATRVYILLLIISLIILIIYTSLTYYLNTFTITNPSLEQYQQLQERYGLAAVSCSCSRSSITQSTFIELECKFHPVCTSHFVSDSYLQELFELYNDLDTTYASSNAYTLQGTIFTHFQTLLVLCNLAKDFALDAQQQYLASTRFFASIPRYIKVLVGLTLFILVVAVIVIPSIYLTRQGPIQTALTRNTVSILLGIGNGRFGSQATFPVGRFPSSIAVGDFNGDGPLDLVVTNSADNTMSVLLGTGTGSFGPQILYSTGLSPQWIVAKDIDGDGQLDLVIVNGYSSNVGVMRGIGNGNFTSQKTYPTFANPTCVAVDDFDGDGCLDLVVISSTWPLMSVLLGTGHGDFRSQTMFTYGHTWFAIVTSDFNGDSRPDIAVTYISQSMPSVGILTGTGNGSFESQVRFLTGVTGLPYMVAVSDINGDARLDLIVAFNSLAKVGVFLGAGNGSFGLPIMFSTGSGSTPYGVAVVDFNNDGRLDIAVTDTAHKTMNILLNTCT